MEKTMFTKKSLGIILVSHDLKRILLVKKRCTYDYDDFILGRYDKDNEIFMHNMFSGMTLEEKLIVKSMDYGYIWFHKHLNNTHTEFYYKCFNKFATNFPTSEAKEKLVSYIDGSTYCGSTLYEYPKGRKNNKTEPNIITAIREVEEETTIKESDYRIIPHIKKMVTDTDRGVRYLCVYYVAILHKPMGTHVKISLKDHCFEISDVSWYTLGEIERLDKNRLYDISKAVIDQLREERKNAKRVYSSVDRYYGHAHSYPQ